MTRRPLNVVYNLHSLIFSLGKIKNPTEQNRTQKTLRDIKTRLYTFSVECHYIFMI